ncbi:MAG: transglycosylase SLT domain-containing protein [Pseudomonas sp.]
MKRYRAGICVLAVFTLLQNTYASMFRDTLPAVELSAAEEAEVAALVLPVPAPWVGDLDGMRQQRLVRLLVPYSKTFYSVNQARQEGISYELGEELKAWLDKTQPHDRNALRWRVMFIPVSRNDLLPKLIAGYGDIAAGGLSITEGRAQTVDFSAPFASSPGEVLVTGPGIQPLARLEQLSGKTITVRRSSSYFEHLTQLNRQFKKQGLAPIDIQAADENLESEDLLEMINAGLLQATVVDSYLATLWKPVLNNIQVHGATYIKDQTEFAWAIRKHSPLLKAQLELFVEGHKVGTPFGNTLRNKYINSKRLVNATSTQRMHTFETLLGYFQRYAERYDFDHLLLMAQGFQESQLNQQARSHRGAVGVMQVLPSTAADPIVGIRGIVKSADRNIEAGTKYMRVLNDRYLTDSELTPLNKTLLSFAAYNAGPTNLRKFRRLAEVSGWDKNVWFDNVEYAAAREVGRETVDYVSNIYKYYIAYRLVDQQARQKDRLKDTLWPH